MPKPVEAEGLKEKPKREPKQRPKSDPRLIAAARELRDRWLEEVNSGNYLPGSQGKYDVSRALESTKPISTSPVPQSSLALPAPLAA